MDEFSIILQAKLSDADCMEITNALNEAYHRGRADKYQEITSEYMLLTEQQVEDIREDAIDECINTVINYCGGLPNGMYVNALKQLKEQTE